VKVTSNRTTVISSLVLAAASALSPVFPGCSKSSIRGDAEADGPVEPVDDGTTDAVDHEVSDVRFDWPEVTDGTPADLVRPEPEPSCGDGVLDGTEECDDGNRLDGERHRQCTSVVHTHGHEWSPDLADAVERGWWRWLGRTISHRLGRRWLRCRLQSDTEPVVPAVRCSGLMVPTRGSHGAALRFD